MRREDPHWSPLQRQLFGAIAGPLRFVVLALIVGAVVLAWIGLREGWFFPDR